MNSPPAVRPATSAGTSACRTVKVCGREIFRRVSLDSAGQLVEKGWGMWVTRGNERHVELTEAAPISTLSQFNRKDFTKPMRADGSGGRAAGQLLGERLSHLEHNEQKGAGTNQIG